MNRNLPTFTDNTIGAHKRDTVQGALSALLGALAVGLSFGLLGAPGAPVALLGVFLSLSGVAGPRPLDKTLFRPAVALPMEFACKVHKVNAHLAPLKLGTPAARRARLWKAFQRATPAVRDMPLGERVRALQPLALAVKRADDNLKMERARWLGAWPTGPLGPF